MAEIRTDTSEMLLLQNAVPHLSRLNGSQNPWNPRAEKKKHFSILFCTYRFRSFFANIIVTKCKLQVQILSESNENSAQNHANISIESTVL